MRAQHNRGWWSTRFCRGALLALAMLVASACQRSTPTAVDSVDLANVLPVGAAYITGTISASQLTTTQRLLVERKVGDLTSGALISVPSDLPIYWRNGRRGLLRDLQGGRVITAWVGETELRSLPPQVSATTIVIER